MKTRRRKRKRAKRDLTEVQEYIQATTSKTLNGDNNDGNNDNHHHHLIMCKLRRTARSMRRDNSRAVTQLTADNFGISDIPLVITDGSPCSVHEDFNPPLP